MEYFEEDSKYYWYPDTERINHANLTEFMHENRISNLPVLLSRSIEDIGWFTDALLKFLNIQFDKPYSQIVDSSEGIPWTRWCNGGLLNITKSCLDKHMGTIRERQTAVIWEGEEGQVRKLNYRELFEQVNQAACALRSLGIQKGDAVGIYMPMTPEIVIAFLAIIRIGGIVLPLFSGFGSAAVATRLLEVGAKALFTADGYQRRGKPVHMKQIADQAVAHAPSVENIIVQRRIGLDSPMQAGRDYWWDEIVTAQPKDFQPIIVDAEEPLMVIYTSGTTGRPKGAVHTHCGFPIKATQDMAFGCDVHAGDTVFWVTDMGWMMGPWLVFGSLLLGATFVIYDGSVDFPTADRLWALIESHQVTMLGISPSLIRAIIPYGEELVVRHNLSSLKTIASTGEPWNPKPWRWLFEVVGKSRLPIINYSGGTELSGGILMGNPLLPFKACSIPSPCPGMDADILDEMGKSIRGQVGELVIKKPWIGMTRGFWKDPQRYIETYWSRWQNIWLHGDWALKDEDDQWYVLGRSDDTIKIAGKRLGPAEVESILVSHPALVEAAAIGIPDEVKGSALVIFCVLRKGITAGPDLESELKALVTRGLGKALAPKQIFFISDLPETRNAKVMRRMVRAAYLGLDPGDTSALVNPDVITEIQQLAQK